MRKLSELALTAGLITALSACGTIGQREIVSAPPIEQQRAAIYPATALKRCPETLSEINLSEDEWNALDAQTQLSLLMRQGQQWIIEYFRCATRHNLGADVYEEQLQKDAAQE